MADPVTPPRTEEEATAQQGGATAKTEHFVRFEGAQLAEVLRNVRSAPPSRVDGLGKWVTIVAAIAGAVWTLIQYMDNEHELKKLEVHIRSLAVEQIKLELEKQRRQLAYDSVDRIAIRQDVTPVSAETGDAIVHFEATIENRSTEVMEISATSLRVYVGRVLATPPTNVPSDGGVLIASMLNNPGAATDLPKNIDWQRQGLAFYVYAPRHTEFPAVEGSSTQEGGGGTSRLNPGESSRLEKFIVVTGRDSDWLGTRLDVFVNAKKGAADSTPPVTDGGNTRTLRYSMPIGALRAEVPVKPATPEASPALVPTTPRSPSARTSSR